LEKSFKSVDLFLGGVVDPLPFDFGVDFGADFGADLDDLLS
jgi:hypothetical protein